MNLVHNVYVDIAKEHYSSYDGEYMIDNAPPLRQKLREMAVETMLDAAERCMIKNGYEKTTMQQIADAAGCAIGTFYLYFKSKEQILRAIIDRHARVVFPAIEDAIARVDDPVGKLHTSIDRFLRYADAHREFFKLFLTAIPTRHRFMVQHLDKGTWEEQEKHARAEVQTIKVAQERGLVRGDLPAEYIEECIMALCMQNLEYVMSAEYPPPVEQQVEMVWTMIAGGIGAKVQ